MKRFQKHHQEMNKMVQKLEATAAKDKEEDCKTCLKNAEQMVVELKDTWKAWRKVKQAALL